jgi:tetratricopeptide (TPR) repeat protein
MVSSSSNKLLLHLLQSFCLTQICTAFNLHHHPSAIKKFTTHQNLIRQHRPTTPLFLSDSNNENNNEATRNKYLTAAEKARRAEEKRRQLRKTEGFATPGISSVIPGAQDLPLDIAKTEREYMMSLSGSDNDDEIDEYNVDKFVALWTEEGLTHLRMLRFTEASASFDKVYQIKPDAYLWQDGIVKYYLGDYHGAAESLAKNAKRYELRFMEPASEERIWRDAAELKVVSSFNGGRKVSKKFTDVPAAMRVVLDEDDNNGIVDAKTAEMESIASERRKVIRIARQLFSCSLRNDATGVALARAQLQACCGDSFPSSLKSTLPTISSSPREKSSSSFASKDHKMYKLHSFFYLGLHYDALGQSYESKQCMKMALKTCAHSISGNGQDITYLLPVIHMTVRDWYDDDEFDVEEEEDSTDETIDLNDEEMMKQLLRNGGVELELNNGGEKDEKTNNTATASSKLTSSLRESIKDMRIVDLKNELKARKLKTSGSKKELQDRLVDDLKREAGTS